jgi:hypothetical protein
MTSMPEIVSAEQWRADRDELLKAEKEATRTLDAIAARRRRLPMVWFDNNKYVFDTPDGPKHLLDLFGEQDQLIVYQFMDACDGLEGVPGDQEPADGDDVACFPSVEALRYPATGCAGTNTPGFDGVPYQKSYWPGSSGTTPTPILFSSPKTGAGYITAYSQFAFETDLSRIEAADLGGVCDRTTGAGCVNPPVSDDGTPVFYPYFSTVSTKSGCNFGLGASVKHTINNFGGSSSAEYGPLLFSTYWALVATERHSVAPTTSAAGRKR